MSRFLLVVPPLAGHIHPTVGLARELTARGHQVAWTGSEAVLRPLLGPDATVLPTGSRIFRAQSGHGLGALRTLWEGFIVPYARFTAKALDRVVTEYRPDVLLVDQHTPAGALTAHRHGLSWASLAPGAMEIGRPFRALPKVESWMTDQLTALWLRAGLPPREYLDPRFSPELVLALTAPALTGAEPFPEQYALVGPILTERPADPSFPWERLDPARRRVLLTMGTLAADVSADFHARAVRALALLGDHVQAVIAAPTQSLPLAELPSDAVAVERAPVLELMSRGLLDAVVCHGGMNTVGEALSHSIPLVVAPIRHDQPFVAAQVQAAGAGLRVPFARVTPPGLAAALRAVLAGPGDGLGDGLGDGFRDGPCDGPAEGPDYRAAAARVGAGLRSGGGAPVAADRLEALAGRAR